MADLTQQLQPRQGASGNGVVVPQGGPSGLSQVASLGSALFGGLAQQQSSELSRQRFEYERGRHERQDRIDTGLDEAAGLELRARMGIQERLDGLDDLRSGVEQGNVPRVRLDAAVRNEVEDLYARYPEARAEIGEMFRQSGFDDLMFRGTAIAIAAENAEVEAYHAQRRAWFDVATEYGVDTAGMSFDEQVTVGRELLSVQRANEQMAAERRLALEEQRAETAAFRAELDHLENQSMNSAMRLANSFMQPHLRSAAELVQAAGDDPAALRDMQSRWPEIVANLRAQRSALLGDPNLNWSASAIEHFTSYTDGLIDDFAAVMMGSEGVPAQRLTALNNFAERAEIDMARAMPLYYDLVDVYGETTVMAALTGADPLSANLIGNEALSLARDELNQYSTDAIQRRQEELTTVQSLLSGDSSVRDINPNMAPAVTSAMVSVVRNTSTRLARDGIDLETNSDDVTRFGNSYAQLLVLGEGFTPGQTDASEVRTFASSVFSPQAVSTLTAMMENEETAGDAQQLITGGRRSAEQALFALIQADPINGLRFQNVGINAEGRFEVQFDEEARRRFNEEQRMNPSGVYIPQSSRPDTRLQRRVDAMNQIVDYLTQTDPYDAGMPETATPRSRRMFWASQGQAALVNPDGSPAGRRRDTTPDQSVTTGNANEAFRSAFENYARSTAGALRNEVDAMMIDPAENAATARPNIPQAGAGSEAANTPPGTRDNWRGAPSSNRSRGSVSTDQIRDAVIAMEANELTGYVPTAGSGVTIAAGFDLGQHSEEQIRNMGLPEDLVERLVPFAGLSTQEAIDEAGVDPSSLVITEDEARAINDYFVNDHISVVQELPASANLSAEALAVAASLRHWAGALGNANPDGKLNPNGTNYVWEVLNNPEGTDEMMIDALIDTLAELTPGTAAANRVRREISALRAR